ncbi:neurochondrin [Kryptolebias marmoratus]|uniref:Neurochondrin n=1 Tax=Kryptolebias marmoratus TaxID=37003 RepID=A0A3Q3B6N6_KRYMA|nr:neurochondrin [Kryptolebias marmoratus]XP_024857982.1 neurochondrin [Kryptolebias marmoratus]XP_024857983.1 neurochondrin [Kryptolebias marmoratus]
MMADGDPAPPDRSSRSEEEEQTDKEEGALTEAQRQVLDRCLHALKHAKNDSQTLAALLLITNLCPANQLDRPTLRRIFEAVGLDLPARLLVTAARGTESSGLPPQELLSLGTALLAALSTDPDLASHPQLLSIIPFLLGIVSNGSVQNQQKQAGYSPETKDHSEVKSTRDRGSSRSAGDDGSESNGSTAAQESSELDEAMAADCYQVLMAVCGLPRGPDQLLSRGAVPALCLAVDQNRTLSHQRGLALLGALLSNRTKEKVWNKHPAELLSLLLRLSREFCRASDPTRLGMCAQLAHFLPPAGVAPKSEELRRSVSQVWVALRPLLQVKLTPRQIGSVLVFSAALLDLYGWEPVGPAKFCCLLVNRACVEIRMGLEEPPGTDLSPELQQTLTGCYRIMEAAMEQACSEGDAAPPPLSSPTAALSLQQSRQVLRVLEEAFSAVMFYLQQVDPSRYDDPFVFATFRSLCLWLAEETSCLKQEVTRLLPFLIGYARHHLQAVSAEQGLSDWMANMSVSKEGGAWAGQEALRYLLPALCHLSAEEGPRKVLLTLETPALLVDFLLQTWTSVKGRSQTAFTRDPSMETACSALLNFTITEPERVRKDPCFRTLEGHLSEALPVLLNKPRLLVLTANYVTLGLMIGRLKSPPSGSVEAAQRRFFSAALQFLSGALQSGSGPGPGPGPVQVSVSWQQNWDEAAELWCLSLQVLGGCVRVQPWLVDPIRDEGWLKHTVSMLSECSALPDRNTQEVLEQVLCAVVERCSVCQQEIRDVMRRSDEGALNKMSNLKKAVGEK